MVFETRFFIITVFYLRLHTESSAVCNLSDNVPFFSWGLSLSRYLLIADSDSKLIAPKSDTSGKNHIAA